MKCLMIIDLGEAFRCLGLRWTHDTMAFFFLFQSLFSVALGPC